MYTQLYRMFRKQHPGLNPGVFSSHPFATTSYISRDYKMSLGMGEEGGRMLWVDGEPLV